MRRIFMIAVFTAALLPWETQSAVLNIEFVFRQYAWKPTNSSNSSADSIWSVDSAALTGTRSGITISSPAITDQSLLLSASASNPSPDIQWAQNLYMEFRVSETTAFTLSGNLYSPNPTDSYGWDRQFVTLLQFPEETAVFSLSDVGLGLNRVPGPTSFSYTGTLLANTLYSLDYNTSWATPSDGFEGNSLSLNLVPEPSAFSLLAVGLGVVALRRCRRSAV